MVSYFPPDVFRGCFTAFRKSLAVRMGELLSRKQKARRFFCELCAVLFCERCDGSPSYKSNGDTVFMHTLENFSEKFLYMTISVIYVVL